MKLKWQRIRDPIYAGGLGLALLLVVAVVLLLSLYLAGISDAAEIRVALGALGGLGTLLLAAGTFLSLWQNEREVEDLRKEREKPIVVDELRNFIQPALNTLESDIENIEQRNREIDWHYAKKYSGSFPNRVPTSVFDRHWIDEEQDIAAIKRFQEDAPELWELIRERENTIEEAIQISNKIEDKIRTPIIEYLRENGIENRKGEFPDMDPLLSATLKNLESYGESHKDYEVWENNRGEFVGILHEKAGEEYKQLMRKDLEIYEISKRLEEGLLSRKIALREDYGVSSEEIETDEESRVSI